MKTMLKLVLALAMALTVYAEIRTNDVELERQLDWLVEKLRTRWIRRRSTSCRRVTLCVQWLLHRVRKRLAPPRTPESP